MENSNEVSLYICEICGDAYVGSEKPTDCPFCGARNNFIKPASEADPIVNHKNELGERDRKNLEETLALEIRANAIYLCMAGKSEDYKIKAMYKRLAKVELEHATVAIKLLGISMPEIKEETCADSDEENFAETIKLEDHAVELYKKFTNEAENNDVRKFFGALAQVEAGHIELIEKIK